jgi:DNA-binding CsgD family transcriptional regulator
MDRKTTQNRLLELAHRFYETTDLQQVLVNAHDCITRSLGADIAGLCVSSPDRSTEYEWYFNPRVIPTRSESYHFEHYTQIVEHDFARRAALKQPNVVLSDDQMIAHNDLRRNPVITHIRETEGIVIERMLAVVLDPRARWHAGFMLYRDRNRPFTDREKHQLQSAVPLLIGVVRSCYLLHRAEAWKGTLESLIRMRGGEVLLIDKHGREFGRTPGLEALLRLHFAPADAWTSSLPDVLANWLVLLLREPLPTCSAHYSRGSLKIEFTRVPPGDYCAVFFEDVLPSRWHRFLTKREVQVVMGVLEGWDNMLIAAELGCAPETVKKHLQAVYAKLNVASRSKLIALLHEERLRNE